MKTAELTGALLDYWVAMAGEEWKRAHRLYPTMTLDPTFSGVELRNYPRGEYGQSILTCVLIPRNPMRQDPKPFCPSIGWDHGGPVIERSGICISPRAHPAHICLMTWSAQQYDGKGGQQLGPTPLIAGMRAKVASVYGDEVPYIPGAT